MEAHQANGFPSVLKALLFNFPIISRDVFSVISLRSKCKQVLTLPGVMCLPWAGQAIGCLEVLSQVVLFLVPPNSLCSFGAALCTYEGSGS